MKAIKHFLEGMAVKAIFAIFSWLPLDTASKIGGWLARKIGPLLSVHRVATRNITQAFPEFSKEQVEQTLDAMWDNLGRTVAEFPHIGKMDRAAYDQIVDVKGAEHFEVMKTSDKGGIFVSGHFANWEVTPKTIATVGAPVALVYRPANNPYVDQLINDTRGNYKSDHYAKGVLGAKKIIKALRNKEFLGMLVDQKQNDGIPVPFFGRDAMTASAVANLALKFDCPLIPIRTVRKEGARFEAHVYPPMEVTKTGEANKDALTLMTQVNQMYEDWVREYPAQWFWVHKRWPAQQNLESRNQNLEESSKS